MATEFGKRLRAAREHAGLTQEQLAAMVQMSQSTLASAEARGAGSRKSPQLARACNVDANWLATGDGPAPTFYTVAERIPNWSDSQHPSGGMDAPTVAHRMSHGLSYAGLTTNLVRVPVIGTLAMGKLRQLELRAEPRGKPLGSVAAAITTPGTYAVRIEGDDLYPAVRHGACLIIEPGGACVPGELVLIEMNDGHFLVRELVALRDDSITMLEASGGSRSTLPLADIRRMDPVASVVAGSKFSPLAPES